MTEAEWMTAVEPRELLAWCGRHNERRLLLFGCACCRLWWELIPEGTCQNAVIAAERFADGECDGSTLRVARNAVEAEFPSIPWAGQVGDVCQHRASWLAAMDAVGAREFEARHALESDTFDDMLSALKDDLAEHMVAAAENCAYGVKGDVERQAQADLLRDIFDNPFRPVVFDAKWRSETAVSLAAAIYEERAFDRLPILADALEEAGCDHADVLSHCRGNGPHARGCWVVDGVLGKE